MPRNWDELGIRWDESDVSRQSGANASDRHIIGKAQVPTLVDLDKAIAAGLNGAILSGINGTSWRVKAQDVCRGMIEKNRRVGSEEMRSQVYNRLRAIMTRSVQVVEREVFVHALPDGSTYEGLDENEYRQLYAVALVDADVDAAVATMLATKAVWKGPKAVVNEKVDSTTESDDLDDE